MVPQMCNLSTQEAEVGGAGVQGQSPVCSEFQTSLGYLRACLKKPKHKQTSKQMIKQTKIQTSREAIINNHIIHIFKSTIT